MADGRYNLALRVHLFNKLDEGWVVEVDQRAVAACKEDRVQICRIEGADGWHRLESRLRLRVLVEALCFWSIEAAFFPSAARVDRRLASLDGHQLSFEARRP